MDRDTIKINLGGLFNTLLAIAFIILKLCNVIDWSWVWVLAPIWIPIAFSLVLIIIFGLIKAILK